MHVVFPALLRFGDVGLLLLRLMVATVFFSSGLTHLRDPAARSKSIGASTGLAIGLMLIMLRAIQKKVFVWKTGFWGGRAYGWHYDLMLLVMNLVILLTGGGKLVVL